RAIFSGFPPMSPPFRALLLRRADAAGTLAPSHRAGALIKPWILPSHLARTGYPPGEAPDEDRIERIGEIREWREELRIEQGEMEEADRRPQDRHIAH